MRANLSKLITAILFCLIMLPASAAAQEVTSQSGAMQQLRITLDSILFILLDPNLKVEQHKSQRMEMVRALFRQHFDELTFCKRALGRHWKERSEAEREEFTQLFSNLLMETYLTRIDGYLNANDAFGRDNVTYLNERTAKNYTLVTTDVQVNQTKKIPVLYRMESIDGNWKVTDIAIEGISMLRNYRAQFNEIIANGSYNELLKRLQAKQV